MALPDHLVPYADLLRRLPAELATSEQRSALMAAIYDEFSERNLAEILEAHFGENRHELFREALHAHTLLRDSPDAVEIRRVLK